MKPIVLVGGGGHCKSVISAIESCGYQIRGILEKTEKENKDCLGYPVIGTDEEIHKYVKDNLFVVTVGSIGDPSLRILLHKKIETAGGKFATVIASTAYVSKHCLIGDGTVILHHATVNACSSIGKGCIINTGADIEHDVKIEDYVHVSTGAIINGGTFIKSRTFIGSGAIICQGITINEDVIVGAGAVVCKNISNIGTYTGIPAVLNKKCVEKR